jgi:hypothetical protein
MIIGAAKCSKFNSPRMTAKICWLLALLLSYTRFPATPGAYTATALNSAIAQPLLSQNR